MCSLRASFVYNQNMLTFLSFPTIDTARPHNLNCTMFLDKVLYKPFDTTSAVIRNVVKTAMDY